MEKPHLTILVGGIAGLSVAYFARTAGLPFTLHEAANRLGGNCVTLKQGPFRFDSGAHRFHDRNPAVTESLLALLDGSMKPLLRPFKYYSRGDYLDYPLAPLNAVRNIGVADTARAVLEIAAAGTRRSRPWSSYGDYAVGTFGRTLADRFLLSYTEKLWGVPCDELESEVAAKRFKGFGPVRMAVRALKGKRRTEDCRYFYPEGGIEAIPAAMAGACGDTPLRTGSRVIGLDHDGRRILRVETGEGRTAAVDEVVSTIPLDDLIRSFRPSPAPEILAVADRLKHRHVALAALFLDKPSVSEAATIYAPDRDLGLIRVYEPRNRDAGMSPAGKTSLVAEYPCDRGDALWSMPDDALAAKARAELTRMGLVEGPEIIGSSVHRMPHAYPVPDREGTESALRLGRYAVSFANLRLSGRLGTHRYLWMHEVIASGRQVVEGLMEKG